MAHSPLTRIARDRQATLDQSARARLALEGRLRSLQEQLAGRRLQLAALSPRATLGRGYSIVTDAQGAVVRSAAGWLRATALAIETGGRHVDATARPMPRPSQSARSRQRVGRGECSLTSEAARNKFRLSARASGDDASRQHAPNGTE